MNEPKSSRYHRQRRRAAFAALLVAAAALVWLLASGVSMRLRDFTAGSPAGHALGLTLMLEAALLPVGWYRTCVLERQYGLWEAPFLEWGRAYLVGVATTVLVVAAAAELLYAAMRLWPAAWWLAAAGSGLLLAGAVMAAAPALMLQLIKRPRSVGRRALGERLVQLARRAGLPDLRIQEWTMPGQDRRACASVVGVGKTRRVLLSAALLADYTDDEIEVVLAHEIGHHVQHHVLTTLVAEGVVLLTGLFAAAAVLGRAWAPIGLDAPADPAGLPLILLVAGGTRLAGAPLLNALSRRQERQADRFALEVVPRPEAFVAAIRRMAAQNLIEEYPSRLACWFFHTHPTVEERIAAATSQARWSVAAAGGGTLFPE